jgi:hypothetical protein
LPSQFCPNPLALPQALGEIQAAAVEGQKRRGRAQDQDRGTVTGLRNHCKLVHIEVNKKRYFSRLEYMSLIYVI